MNLEKRYLGRTDEPLAPEGRLEIEQLYPCSQNADIIFVSPMKRCIETAEIIFAKKDPAEYVRIYNWREIDFGLFEGKNYSELNGNPAYQAWIDGGGQAGFPEGEDVPGFRARVQQGFELFLDICGEYIKKAGCVRDGSVDLTTSAVVHGGTIMAIVSGLTGRDYYEYMCENGKGYRLVLDPAGRMLKDPEKIKC